jgi:protein-disulfide isomerase
MSENTMTKRVPIILAVIGIFLLSSTAVYLFRAKPVSDISADGAVANADANAAISAAGMTRANRKATEAIVRAYILQHPEIITQALGLLQKHEATQRLGAAKDVLSTPFYGAQAGNPSGDVTVVEFTDYNCGFCRASVPDVERLVAADKGVHVIYREVPILAASSKDAALWALAAAKQGKHAQFHKAMFGGGRPDAATIRVAAITAGLDIAAAGNFIASSEALTELKSNLAIMQQVGFNGTPTFIVGDQMLEGALGYDKIKAAVDKARKER